MFKSAASWMEENLFILGTKKLKEICIPGSHDSGMSILAGCNNNLITKEVVLTQSFSIFQQLLFGIRYFDIRPVIFNGIYYTGHFYFINGVMYGGVGETIDEIIDSTNRYTKIYNELVIFNISHGYNIDESRSSLNQNEWDKLFSILCNINYLYHDEESVNLTEINLNKYILKNENPQSSVIIIIRDRLAPVNSHNGLPVSINPQYLGKGFFYGVELSYVENDKIKGKVTYELPKQINFPIYDNWSDTEDLSYLKIDQLNKLRNHNKKYFLLSWTLSLTSIEKNNLKDIASITNSILNYANLTNQMLNNFVEYIQSDEFQDCYPNIIQIDKVDSDNITKIAMEINFIRIEKTNKIANKPNKYHPLL